MFARLFFALLNQIPMISGHWSGRWIRSVKNRTAKRFFGRCMIDSNIRPKVTLRNSHNIYLGAKSSIGDKSRIIATERVEIGDGVLMAPEVVILTENHRIATKAKILDSGTEKKSVTIGDDVWIGTRAIILPGADIPDGCIVAAGAVVPGKTYPAYSVIGGVPAKVIRQRRYE